MISKKGKVKNGCSTYHFSFITYHFFVEVSGFEPLTPAMSRRYSNQLSYTSMRFYLLSCKCRKDSRGFLFSKYQA
jgi:hypothetical protein